MGKKPARVKFYRVDGLPQRPMTASEAASQLFVFEEGDSLFSDDYWGMLAAGSLSHGGWTFNPEDKKFYPPEGE